MDKTLREQTKKAAQIRKTRLDLIRLYGEDRGELRFLEYMLRQLEARVDKLEEKEK